MPPIWTKDGSIDMAKWAALAKGGRGLRPSLVLEAEKLTVPFSSPSPESLGAVPPSSRWSAVLTAESEAQTWTAEARAMGKNRRTSAPELGIPDLEWPARQDPSLTATVRHLLNDLWAIVVSRALQTGFRLDRTTVSVFEDPTEHEHKAVLRLTCSANASQTLAFWDSLEPDLQNWLQTLAQSDRTTFITKIGLRVHWR